MNFITYEEFKKREEYQDFIKQNPEIGTLKVEVSTAHRAIPIPNTEILVTKDINNETIVFFEGKTDSSGIIENIKLPAPRTVSSKTPLIEPNYTIYDLTATRDGYKTIQKYHIGMFGGINIIQLIKMVPEITLEGENDLGN